MPISNVEDARRMASACFPEEDGYVLRNSDKSVNSLNIMAFYGDDCVARITYSPKAGLFMYHTKAFNLVSEKVGLLKKI